MSETGHAGVTRWRKRPVEVSMIRWDGSDEALQLIGGSGGYAGKREAMQRDSDGALSIWVEASRTCMWLSLGDWAAIEPGGTGVYPIRAADQEAGYEPVSSAGTPHGPRSIEPAIEAAAKAIGQLLCVQAGWAFGVPEDGRREWLQQVAWQAVHAIVPVIRAAAS